MYQAGVDYAKERLKDFRGGVSLSDFLIQARKRGMVKVALKIAPKVQVSQETPQEMVAIAA